MFCHAAGNPTDTGRGLLTVTEDSASGTSPELGEYRMRSSSEQDSLPFPNGNTGPQLRTCHWVAFAAGNLISIAVVIAEIFQLFDVRLDDYVGRCEDEEQGSSEATTPSQISVSQYVDSARMFLIYALVFHVYFSAVLSLVYRWPLSLQSLHKIPTGSSMSRAVFFHVHLLAPVSWMWIVGVGFFGALGSTSCTWEGGSWLGVYLLFSWTFAFFIFGLTQFIGIFVVLITWSMSTFNQEIMDKLRQSFLSKGTFLHCFWQLQGVLWVYRVGGLGLEMSVFVAICSVIGVTLTAVGSRPAPSTARTSQDDEFTIAFDDAV